MKELLIPADVPDHKHTLFCQNYHAITKRTGRLLLFSSDHIIEHMHDDFDIDTTHPYGVSPEHIIEIAQESTIGAFSGYLGMINRHFHTIKTPINLFLKLNGGTNLAAPQEYDPHPGLCYSVDDALNLSTAHPTLVRGVIFNLYLGGAYEHEMLKQAAQIVLDAHKNGLLALLTVYPRGKTVVNERDYHLIAGAAGVAHALGADFVKVKLPEPSEGIDRIKALKIIVNAAGNTGVLCATGNDGDTIDTLQDLYEQIHEAGITGCVVGRNLFQRSLIDAKRVTDALSAIIYNNENAGAAMRFLQKD